MAKGLIGGRMGDDTQQLSPEQAKQREADHRLVKGKFVNNECKGGTVKFPFRKWRGDAVKWYLMRDGEEYEIPIMVAKHLNENCAIPEYEYSQLLNADGSCDKRTKRVDHRFSFIYSGV